MKEKKKI